MVPTLLLLAACAEHSSGGPRISSIEPSAAGNADAVRVIITGEDLFVSATQHLRGASHVHVDQAFEITLVPATLGGDLPAVVLLEVERISSVELSAKVPALIAPGHYSVKLQAPTGEDSLPEAYTALSAIADAGADAAAWDAPQRDSAAADSSVVDGNIADVSTSDAAIGDTAIGDTASRDTAISDTATGDTATRDTAIGDTAIGDSATGDSAASDVVAADAWLADVEAVDSAAPDTAATDGALPDVTPEDSAREDSSAPDSAVPDAVGPDGTGVCIDRDGDGYGRPGDPSCANGPTTDCDDNPAWCGASCSPGL